jgi:hypothetical protein
MGALAWFAIEGGNQPANVLAPDKLAALDDWEAILFVMVGSFTLLLLDLIDYARLPAKKRPDLKDRWFWLVRLVLRPLLALIVGFVFVRGHQPLTTLTAVALGAGSVEILQRILSGTLPRAP